MGLLPLIKGLPVRLTDHIDRNLGLYKQTKCTIHGWTLNINEASAKDDRERVLDFQPDMIYLKFENAKWRVHDDLEQGVYPMKVTGKIWNISENTKMKAKRLGFQIVPDFGQTAHSVQGASLAAVIVDCLKVDLCTKTTEMLAAYIGLSRVRCQGGAFDRRAFLAGPVLSRTAAWSGDPHESLTSRDHSR